MINKFEGRYRFLSNFYPCEIEYKGITYPSVEHYYVSMKVNDLQIINGKTYPPSDVREIISKIPNPAQIKKMGRSFKLRKDWDDIKLKVMEYGVTQKFTKHENLKELLLSTGDQELIEGNWWHDNFFGSCSCIKCGDKGENNLGKILMKIRSNFQS